MVLELSYGATRIVLGGDLPRVESGSGKAVPTGWGHVMESYSRLAEHQLLKIAHHGSIAAWHDDLMAPPPSERAWAVTPFARSSLPRAGSLPALLACEQPLYVSHPPPSWHVVRGPRGAPVSASSIHDRRDVARTGDPFADAAEDIRPQPPVDPLHPVWAFAFDDAAKLRGAWYGDTALTVV
ncbi:MAG: hypothetical protein KF729_22970 [Sandaracinaceae bacterium]|nr:hypothetical protein [Sandaracinaceae bacterium]